MDSGSGPSTTYKDETETKKGENLVIFLVKGSDREHSEYGGGTSCQNDSPEYPNPNNNELKEDEGFPLAMVIADEAHRERVQGMSIPNFGMEIMNVPEAGTKLSIEDLSHPTPL